jgi:hypothetical protein
MNRQIQELADEHLRHEMYAAYGEIIEGDYYEFDPQELQEPLDSATSTSSDPQTGQTVPHGFLSPGSDIASMSSPTGASAAIGSVVIAEMPAPPNAPASIPMSGAAGAAIPPPMPCPGAAI